MHSFAQVSLKRKLLIVFLFTSTVAVLFACIGLAFNDIILIKQNAQEALSSQAELIGAKSIAGLSLQDYEAGTKTLGFLRFETDIILGIIYDEKGRVFSTYKKYLDQQIPSSPDRIVLDTLPYDSFAVLHTIIHDNKPIGSIYLQSDLTSLRNSLLRYATIVGIVFLTSIFVAFLLSTRLQRLISDPILQLTDMTNHVSREKDYSLRLQKQRQDEVGMLIDGFNDMLEHIQIRDMELLQHRDHLEELVVQRTDELSQSNAQLKIEIRDRKQAEELAAQAARDLAKKNHELSEARDKALEAARLKSNFLATMSHEIRTPMNGILGFTGILLDSGLTSSQRESAETVRSSAENLLTIINDILDFSKIEAGKLSIEPIDFDLRTTVDDVMELLGTQASEKSLELVGFVSADIPSWLHGDPQRLRQILLNLIGNAIKFTERGEVTVYVRLEEQQQDRVIVHFDIRDTGIGISSEAQERLFQPFMQADSSTTRRYGGTGLGLAICKQLVENMGGRIGVDSQAGAGSRVWFNIALRPPTSPSQATIIPRSNLQGLRICCVDDNATNRRLIAEYAKEWDMNFNETHRGAIALTLLDQAQQNGEPFDLIILDSHIPEMEGITLARLIKSRPSLAALRLIFMTSAGQKGEAAESREAGIDGYLTKPVRKKQLYDCLTFVMGRSPATDSQSQSPLVTVHTIKEMTRNTSSKILVADDHIINQKLAVLMLEKLGHQVDVVTNGQEVVEALDRESYTLILMDCQMPVLDGYEATKQIRRQEGATRHIPIIAMTANAMKGDREKCQEAGMDDYLAKPILAEELQETITRWLPHSPTSEEKG